MHHEIKVLEINTTQIYANLMENEKLTQLN